jgi:hypothetical protein
LNLFLQVGAIAPQGLESLLQNIHDCLGSTDWATRKAAADALSAIALHSSRLIADGAANSTLTVLEACRFDKVPSSNHFFFSIFFLNFIYRINASS